MTIENNSNDEWGWFIDLEYLNEPPKKYKIKYIKYMERIIEEENIEENIEENRINIEDIFGIEKEGEITNESNIDYILNICFKTVFTCLLTYFITIII